MVGRELQSQPRNYLGMAGIVIALIGMFLPCVELWFIRISYAEALVENDLEAVIVLIFAVAICAGVLCFRSVSHVRWIGAALLAGLILSITLPEDDAFLGGILDYLEYGFWVMAVGLAVVILSPSLAGNTAPRFIGNHAYPTARTKASAGGEPQWTCKSCGKKNLGNGNYCSICGKPNPAKLFCPGCGKPVAAGDVFCMHCRVNLAEARRHIGQPLKPAAPPPPPDDPNLVPASSAREGVWQMDVNAKGIPRAELVIAQFQEKAFTFDLTQNSVYAIHAQPAKMTSQDTAAFTTTDGTGITGIFTFEGNRVLLFIEKSGFPYLASGEVLVFDTPSVRRSL